MNKKYNSCLILLVMGFLLTIASYQSNLYGFGLSNFGEFLRQNSIGTTANDYYQRWMPTFIQEHPLLCCFTSLLGIGLFTKYIYPKLFINKKNNTEFVYSQCYNVPNNPEYDITASTYDELKKQFTQCVSKKNTDGIVYLLMLNTHPKLLRQEACNTNFYTDIFKPFLTFLLKEKTFDCKSLKSVLNVLLADKMYAIINKETSELPSYSNKQKEFIACQMAQLFNTLSINTQAKKFALAEILIASPLGNAILCKWLELDPSLPFTEGIIAQEYQHISYVSTVNLIQWMLRCYTVQQEQRWLKETHIDHDTMLIFVEYWKKNNQLKKESQATIQQKNGMGIAYLHESQYWLPDGKYTTENIAKKLNLLYLFQ